MTQMSDALLSTLGAIANDADMPAYGDTGEFDEYKDQPKPPVVFELEDKESTVPDLINSDAKTDYVHARNVTYTLLKMTSSAVANALVVAQQTEHPRAFESFNSLVGTARLLTQDLLGMQKVFKEITKGRPETEPPPVVNQTQINGNVNVTPKQSTTDILEALNQAIANGEITPLNIGD